MYKNKNKNMFKGLVIIAVMISLILLLTGCSSDIAKATNVEVSSNLETDKSSDILVSNSLNNEIVEGEKSVSLTKNEHYINIKDLKIEMHNNIEPILLGLGEPQSYFESTSCAFKGLDRMYNYGSFEIVSYESGDDRNILSLIIFDDTVKTNKGIRIGDSKDKILSAYGNPINDLEKLLVYESDTTYLSFILNDDLKLISIEYSAAIDK